MLGANGLDEVRVGGAGFDVGHRGHRAAVDVCVLLVHVWFGRGGHVLVVAICHAV